MEPMEKQILNIHVPSPCLTPVLATRFGESLRNLLNRTSISKQKKKRMGRDHEANSILNENIKSDNG
jgi:hypothetical protein